MSAADPLVELQRGLSLYQQGQIREAEAIYGALQNRYANNPQVLNGLGAVAAKSGAVELALAYLSRATALAPRHAPVLTNFASALLSLYNVDPAIDSLERAVAIDPSFDPAWFNLARALNIAGEPTRAAQVARRLKAKNEGHVGARGVLVNALVQLGQRDEAEREAREMVSRWPDKARGYTAIVETGATPDTALLDQAQRVLDEKRSPPQDVREFGFALAHMYDRAGRIDDAFRTFTFANEFNAQTYNRQFVEERTDWFMQTFDKAVMAMRRGHGHKARTPILLAGMPRSGMGVVESVLTSHADVASVGDARQLRAVAMSANGFMSREEDLPTMVRALTNESLEFLGHRYVELLRRLAEDRTKSRVVERLTHDFSSLGLAALIVPEATVVHVRRSPMATLLSCWMQNFDRQHGYAGRFEDLAHYYGQHRKLMAHWHDVLGARIIDVSYDDLVKTPDEQASQLIKRIGLRADGLALNQDPSRPITSGAARLPVHQRSLDHWKAYDSHLAPLRATLQAHGIAE